MARLFNYIQAARLRTLPLSVSGIIIASFLAASQNAFNYTICFLAILTTIGFQVLSNFANDYGDGVKGTDNNRKAEQRMVASGVISPKQMKQAMIITALITVVFALLLIYVALKTYFLYSLFFIILGIACIVVAIKYTVGKSAYGYSGFGDVFVFLFFGLVSVLGGYFLFTKHVDGLIFLPAASVGLLSTAVLNLNNLRDREQDKKNNKNTLVVKLGNANGKKYHYFLVFGALITAVCYVVLSYKSPLQFLFLIAFIPLIKNVFVVANNQTPLLLDAELKKVALSTFLFAILFGLGLVL